MKGTRRTGGFIMRLCPCKDFGGDGRFGSVQVQVRRQSSESLQPWIFE